jgi:putative ABC transport system substrate-binding protein
LKDVEAAAGAMGLQIQVFSADTSSEIDAVFAQIGRERPDALFVGASPFFNSRRVQLAQWAARLGIPAIFGVRLYAEVGGLMSYAASLADAYRQAAAYAGRILKGAKPADLPVVQSTKIPVRRQSADRACAGHRSSADAARPRRRGDRMTRREFIVRFC